MFSTAFFNILKEPSINSTKERSDTQLSGAENFEGVALPGWLHAHLQQSDIEIKSKFEGANSGCKKNLCQYYSYIMS